MNLNFPANLGEVVEFAAEEVEELVVLIIVVVGDLGLDELQDEGQARANFIVTWEKDAVDECFEDTGLTIALAVDDGDLVDWEPTRENMS